MLIFPQCTASLDIDAQNCFSDLCPDELPVPNAQEIVTELNAQAKLARYRIASKDAHPINPQWLATSQDLVMSPIDGENVDVRWPRHAVPGTLGCQLLNGLPPVTQYDFFVWKGIEPDMHPYGACYHDFAEKLSTGLIEFLQTRDIKTILVGGLATDYCVKITVLQLLNAGFSVILNQAACRGIAIESTKAALLLMEKAGAKLVKSSADLVLSGE